MAYDVLCFVALLFPLPTCLCCGARIHFWTGARTLSGSPVFISSIYTLMNNHTSTSPWQSFTSVVSPCSGCPGQRNMDTQAVFSIKMLKKMQPHGMVANYQLKSGLNDVALLQISRPEECKFWTRQPNDGGKKSLRSTLSVVFTCSTHVSLMIMTCCQLYQHCGGKILYEINIKNYN